MRILLLLMLIQSFNAFSQDVIVGRVISEQTGEPVAFASVTLMNTNIGTNADSSGKFTLRTVIMFPDTLLISSGGYKECKILVANLDGNILIKMTPYNIELDPLIIRTYKSIQKISSFPSCGSDLFVNDGYVIQMAKKFTVPIGGCKLQFIELCKSTRNARFRIRVYRTNPLNSSIPDEDLMDSVLEVISSKQRIKVDLSSYQIIIPDSSFFVAIEWLLLPENITKDKKTHPVKMNSSIKYAPFIGIKLTNGRSVNSIALKDFQGRWRAVHFSFEPLISVVLETP